MLQANRESGFIKIVSLQMCGTSFQVAAAAVVVSISMGRAYVMRFSIRQRIPLSKLLLTRDSHTAALLLFITSRIEEDL